MVHSKTEAEACPLAAVDRRLEDVHQHWHAAQRDYFDPERFRIAIQTAIQTLRTVTFVLQSHKARLRNFEPWYEEWQQRLRNEPLMRWMVDARNRIEKQGDLDTHSFVRAEIVASYLNNGPCIDVPANLFDSAADLLAGVPAGPITEHVRSHGALRIQRRWVENSLPAFELLEAVAVAYGRIAELVRDAHRLICSSQADATNASTGAGDPPDGRLPCMIGHEDKRSLVISLSDGSPIEFEENCRVVDARDLAGVKVRYGDTHRGMFGPPGASLERIASSLFETARKVFLLDGYHGTIFIFFRGRSPIDIVSHRPRDQRDKYLMMRNLGREVTRRGADAVVAIGEVWAARADASTPYKRPADSPERKEFLTTTLVRRHGVPVRFSAEIIRQRDALGLGKRQVDRNFSAFAFAPVYEAWGRPIPAKWLRTEQKFFGGKCSRSEPKRSKP